ncbi:MFS transporter [Rhodoplanes roseus]|uniref:MFS transporter n=1 Tax=Rhodoplanes roseus TaxID=29409 RepID=A0A327KRA8_9BRAD|nr:MFS transporter [Rhodoplanes roseus]RAI41429.1 MFS transporter [Rhodoplanes roseus]
MRAIEAGALLRGPWRALPVLGVTQVLAWGALFYPPVLTVPLIAAERGWSLSFTMGGFSAALLAAGLVAPLVGRLIDRRGGHVAMTAGSLSGALGLVLLAVATHPAAYLGAWVVIGVAMAASLYDPAFATLGRLFGAAARRPITLLTFVGGLASTVSWPATRALCDGLGWQGCCLVYAALLALVAAPLHAFALPRKPADPPPAPPPGAAAPAAVVPPHGKTFLLVMAGFAAYAFVPSALSAHLIAMLQRGGIDAATAVTIGMLFGPCQVLARVTEFAFGSREHPLHLARFAIALMVAAFALLGSAGVSVAAAAAFYVMFGACNGLVTIARGTLPLALFGPHGFGAVVGRLAAPWLAMQAAAPLVLALTVERASDTAALALAAAFAAVSLGCFLAIRKPG